jgi:hypothetical protein
MGSRAAGEAGIRKTPGNSGGLFIMWQNAQRSFFFVGYLANLPKIGKQL